MRELKLTLTRFKGGDGDVVVLQGLSVQLAFGLDLSRRGIDLQPASSVTVQFVTAQNTPHEHHYTNTRWQTR